MSLTIQNLAELCFATVHGGNSNRFIESVADIMSANANQVTVLSDSKYVRYLKNSTAAACFIADNEQVIDFPIHIALLRCADPEISFLIAIKTLHPASASIDHQIAPQAVVAESATLGANVHIGAFSTVGENTRINDNGKISPGVHIGANVVIGKNCLMSHLQNYRPENGSSYK
jgi:UDP-3-O-[3-hydroxymyristoyl] glucosamine N-acyltransferase